MIVEKSGKMSKKRNVRSAHFYLSFPSQDVTAHDSLQFMYRSATVGPLDHLR